MYKLSAGFTLGAVGASAQGGRFSRAAKFGKAGTDYPVLGVVPYTNFYCDEQPYPPGSSLTWRRDVKVYSRGGHIVTKPESDDGIPGKSKDTLKYYGNV
ncbi:hypothetical protein EVAR_3027_1 [Eumeta japonica]|uniref:Uncharacterized protein n=1 Tax=Eumeta variegata TaxID=151549 RepID=A0A4C1SUA6_EUMVA|nr:hypothetical protein EVAR_3027_1 [Eumeta japonica]